MPLFKSSTIAKLLSVLSPFICLAAIVVLQAREYKKSVRQLDSEDYLADEKGRAQRLNWDRNAFALGFDNLQADLVYLDFVQYFGDRSARETIGYNLVPDYFETITSIDPRFTQANLRLGIANTMYAGNPEETIAYMQQALAAVDPESEQAASLWSFKGLDELLFLGDVEAANKSYDMAARWTAPAMLERPEFLTAEDLSATLEERDEIKLKEAQIFAWSSVLVHIRDNQKKREILDKISGLKAELLALRQLDNSHLKTSE